MLSAIAVSAMLLVAGCGGDEEKSGDASGDSTSTTAKGAGDLATATEEMNKAEIVDLTTEAAPAVHARDNYFDPKYIEVKLGTTVTFDNDGRNVHNVLPVEDGAFTPLETGSFDPGATGQITFDKVGEFPFYCSLHASKTKGMIGGVKVVE